jgi:hypothetical protein
LIASALASGANSERDSVTNDATQGCLQTVARWRTVACGKLAAASFLQRNDCAWSHPSVRRRDPT